MKLSSQGIDLRPPPQGRAPRVTPKGYPPQFASVVFDRVVWALTFSGWRGSVRLLVGDLLIRAHSPPPMKD